MGRRCLETVDPLARLRVAFRTTGRGAALAGKAWYAWHVKPCASLKAFSVTSGKTPAGLSRIEETETGSVARDRMGGHPARSRAGSRVTGASLIVMTLVAVLATTARASGSAGAGSFRLHPEVVTYTGVRFGGGQDAPEALEPRGGASARVGLGVHGSGWSAQVALGYDGLQVPFRSDTGRWDPGVTGLSFPPRGAVRVDEAWVQFGEALWMGRRGLDLGGGTGLIGLPNTPGVDQVGAQVRLGPGSYRKVVGRLVPGERYLLAHQLDLGPVIGPRGSLRLSGYELAVVSSRFAALPYTWVPLWPGYLTQHVIGHGEVGNDANFYIGVAADVERPFGWNGRVRAEVLVDDMPQNPEQHIIYQVSGALVAEAGTGWSVRYARVNNYVGTFQVPALSLVHSGRLLAFPDGPDSDSLGVSWRRPQAAATGVGGLSGLQLSGVSAGVGAERPSGLQLTGVSLEWRRRGPGRIGDIWEAEGFEAAKAREFLAGTVEHALLVSAELWVGGRAMTTVTVGPIWNTANQPGHRSFFVGMALVLR